MMARIKVGNSTGSKCVVLPAILIFMLCGVVFSGILNALPTSEADTETIAVAVPETTAETEAVVDENPGVDVGAALEELLQKNNKCLRCHSRERFKTLEDGTQMPLQVHKEDYTGSAHGEIACVSCHEAIGNRKHPSKSTNITIADQREYAVEINQSCRNCHDKKFTQYEGSIHASMVSQGSAEAPLCSDCHSAHAVETMKVYQPDTGYPCKQCHENIFNAYSESVHGSARATGNVIRDEHIQAPICMDCHQSHEVTAVEIGDTLRSECMDCHENVPLLHSQWLPNAGTHLDIVSCAVCHAPFAKHRFDLHLYDNIAQVPAGQQENFRLFQQQLKEIEEAGGDIDPLAVWKLVEEKSGTSLPADISLRGRMEVRSGVWAHQIASKAFAVRTCDSCHQQANRQGLNVTLSIPQESGKVLRIDADREALGQVNAIESMSDFYALGGNTNKLLDILLLLSLASGFAIPIGHFTLGKMIKEKMQRGEE